MPGLVNAEDGGVQYAANAHVRVVLQKVLISHPAGQIYTPKHTHQAYYCKTKL